MEVVGVLCDDHGNVDVDDLRAKAEKYSDILAAVMITYPSTHGVFEERVREICEIDPRPRRPGLSRWREPQRPGRRRLSRQVRSRRLTPQPAQDLLHPSRRRRPRRRSHRGRRTPRALSAQSPATQDQQPRWPGLRRTLRLSLHPRHLLGLHPAHGRRRPNSRHRESPSSTPTTSPPALTRTSLSSTGTSTAA